MSTPPGMDGPYEGYACTYPAGFLHHIAFINDISANNLDAADTNDCAKSRQYERWSRLLRSGRNDCAELGSRSYLSRRYRCRRSRRARHIRVLIISFTEIFRMQIRIRTCRSVSDTEDFMADTWDYHNAGRQGIFANNIGFDADRMCIQIFEQNFSKPTPAVKIYNNTCFKNNNYTGGNWVDGEINITSTNSPMTYAVTTYNNVAYQPLSVSSGGGGVAAYVVGNLVTTYTGGGSGLQNILKGNNSSCKGPYCNSTFDAQAWGSSAMLGTETYTNPSFTNTTDLLANQLGFLIATPSRTRRSAWDGTPTRAR